MKTKEYHNLDKLIKVKVCDFYLSNFYKYKKERKYTILYGLITIRFNEGVYRFDGNYIGYLPENHVIIDDKVYEKPELRMIFENDIEKTVYFDTFEDAIKAGEDITILRRGLWI